MSFGAHICDDLHDDPEADEWVPWATTPASNAVSEERASDERSTDSRSEVT